MNFTSPHGNEFEVTDIDYATWLVKCKGKESKVGKQLGTQFYTEKSLDHRKEEKQINALAQAFGRIFNIPYDDGVLLYDTLKAEREKNKPPPKEKKP